MDGPSLFVGTKKTAAAWSNTERLPCQTWFVLSKAPTLWGGRGYGSTKGFDDMLEGYVK